MSALNHLRSMPGVAHATVTTTELREIMLTTGGQMLANGTLWEITQKSLGAGVYRISTKRWEP